MTDRCNYRCTYCMPPGGVDWLPPSEILTYEEMLRLIAVFAGEGITSVRLTGGEPLVRKGIVAFVAKVKALGCIRDLSLTTNGSLLPAMATELKAAGLDRVNISLDTIDPDRFTRITTCGSLEETLRGVESAFRAGLSPVKLNVVLTEFLAESDLAYFLDMAVRFPVAIRFIEYMPIGGSGLVRGMNPAAVKEKLAAMAGSGLEPAESKGSGPARYYRLPGASGVWGFITPLSEHFCGSCNRMRLTADGRLKPCLLSDREIDIKTPLRAGADDARLAELFRAAVRAKPERHSLCRASGHPGFQRCMPQIGG